MSNTIDVETVEANRRRYKVEWQRRQRAQFKRLFGFSQTANYCFGKLRKLALDRDGHRCVKCGLTDQEHRAKWGRPITVDHIDRNRKHNTLSNFQTLCLRCHGRKDGAAQTSKLRGFQAQIMAERAKGISCNQIAQRFGVGCRVVTKWVKRWNGGKL